MGQKVWPLGFRVGITENWRSRWYAKKKEFGGLLVEDQKIRKFVEKEYKFAGVPRLEIERTGADPQRSEVTVTVWTARPGLLIGKKGAKVDKLKESLAELTKKKVNLNIVEVQKPELEALLVAESVAEQLLKRQSFRRVIKKAVDQTMQAGAKGCKIMVAGRLGGAEMARCEETHRGSIPLTTLQANIDYAQATAVTTHGAIGVKCWVYRGLFGEENKETTDGPDAKKSKVQKAPKR